ncbi:sperm flagellar protein 1 [Haematobia irritans]|uniref:sperm flagellar protein 1 n=1 Tax=Haematobia irritans TaxID=7368 RepID=UPI003F4F414C
MPKKLTDDEYNELKSWLQQQGVSYKNIHRDFSDARPIVNILKKLHPKLVEIHNYPPRNSTQLKLNNWETLNHKVLTKLDLHQSKPMLDKLAKGVPGAIESLLYDIMLKDQEQQEKCKTDQPLNEQEQIWTENDEVMTITITKKIGDGLIQVPQKMILYSIYEKILRDSQVKDHIIMNAEQKITHLENIIKLKTERIDELCGQMAKLSMRNLLRQSRSYREHSGSGDLLNETISNKCPLFNDNCSSVN